MAGDLYFSPFGEHDEVFEQDQLPACCQRTSRTEQNFIRVEFECPGCGAIWRRLEGEEYKAWRRAHDASA